MINLEFTERWNSGRLGALFFENKEKNNDFNSDAAYQFYFGRIIPKKKFELTPDLIETYKKYTLIKPGDIMINGLNLNYDFVTQRVGIALEPGIITSAYLSIRARKEINTQYYCFLLKTVDAQKMFHGLGTGIRKTLSFSDIKGLEIPVPPIEEQNKMVMYLNWKLSKIHELLKVKKEQLKELKEFRCATIDEAIFHGIKSDAKTKESNVYWLGNVPEDWEVTPLKRVCSIGASVSEIIKSFSDDDKVPFIPMENVSVTGDVDYSILRPLMEIKSGYSSFAKNDVVIAKITPCFENGKGAALTDMPCEVGYGTTEFINLRSSDRILPEFLYRITNSRTFRILGEKVMTGSAGQKRIPTSYVKNFTCGIPSINEQIEIIDYLGEKLIEIDNAIDIISKEIEVLKEYKVKLIADVVTGQIDVRDIEVPDFEYVEEREDTSDDDELDEDVEANDEEV